MLGMVEFPSATALLSVAASAAAAMVWFASDSISSELREYLQVKFSSLIHSTTSQNIVTIRQFNGPHKDQLFRAAEVYLSNKISPSTPRFQASIPDKGTEVILSIEENEVMIDVFEGVEYKWKKLVTQMAWSPEHEAPKPRAQFELRFNKNHGAMVLKSYIPHIFSEFLRLEEEKKTLKIHLLKGGYGGPRLSLNLDHPATFETLAMDPKMKKTILDDLDMFLRRKEFYKRVGKAWKRGYLLSGPTGTGKSSLIAAIANHLKFDIYDLELTNLICNSDLRDTLISIGNRSILVVEDIDCSIKLDNRKKKVIAEDFPRDTEGKRITLSGMLNFIDGLLSSCGDERIIIFTTNHKEHLDPALLRPGRMDLHIHMSYCTPCGFRKLASNYLGITKRSTKHPLIFKEVEQLMPTAKVTPAEVCEQLLRTEDPKTALRGLVTFLKKKEEENDLKADGPEKEREEGDETARSKKKRTSEELDIKPVDCYLQGSTSEARRKRCRSKAKGKEKLQD